MALKTAEAVWNGSLMQGNGHLKSQSGKVDIDYGWKARIGDGAAILVPGGAPGSRIGRWW